MLRPWFALLGLWQAEQPTGIGTIRERVVNGEEAMPGLTSTWELDVAPIPSQHGKRAWDVYCNLLINLEHPFEPIVYARPIEGSLTILQYWYLYLYNDFDNNHEGDWEMVTIELAEDHAPERIGVSSHSGGLGRGWDDPKVLKDGDHTVVYVARGSHAGYYKYSTSGLKAVRVIPRLNFPKPFRFLEPVQRGLHQARRKLLPIWDHPAADSVLDENFPETERGVRVEPLMKIMPSNEASLDSEWWWLRFLGSWGSSHSRLIGHVGPAGPWAASPNGQDTRWHHPARWLATIDRDQD